MGILPITIRYDFIVRTFMTLSLNAKLNTKAVAIMIITIVYTRLI
jgi:hypothetical protein